MLEASVSELSVPTHGRRFQLVSIATHGFKSHGARLPASVSGHGNHWVTVDVMVLTAKPPPAGRRELNAPSQPGRRWSGRNFSVLHTGAGKRLSSQRA